MSVFKPLIASEVTFTLRIEPEEDSPHGHFASGDAKQDKADERAILKRLSDGDECAWCCLEVTATDADGNEASDSLGAVSLNENHPWGDRLEPYIREQYPDLWSEALLALNAKRLAKHTPRLQRVCETKYLGPTNHRGSRVRARHITTRKTATVPWDHALDSFENHADAAEKVLGRRPEWAASVDGGGYLFGIDPSNDPAS